MSDEETTAKQDVERSLHERVEQLEIDFQSLESRIAALETGSRKRGKE